ncbi:phospholipase D-like domain-containing protein [Crocosphaera sp. Alani8]|uniref:phospholipase D-like domain-containing protein n=1 Tax=Crocosphaera sp. Alani8 TaxID=3038952 RepID=UPI00313F3C8D
MRKQLNNQNRISTHLLEKLAIGSSLLGMGITVATQQVLYSVAPLTLALGINFLNRQKLEKHSNKKIEKNLELVAKELVIHLRPNVNYNITQIKANKNSILESKSNLEILNNKFEALKTDCVLDISKNQCDFITISNEIEEIKKKIKKSVSNTSIDSLQSEIREIDNNKHYELLEIKQAISDLENHRLNELNNLEFEITSLKQKFEDVITYSAINQLKSEIRDIKDYTYNNIEKVINTTFIQVKNNNFIELNEKIASLKNQINYLNDSRSLHNLEQKVKETFLEKLNTLEHYKEDLLTLITEEVEKVEKQSKDILALIFEELEIVKKENKATTDNEDIQALKQEVKDLREKHNNISVPIVNILNKLRNLQKISHDYEYTLLFGRKESRQVFIDALKNTHKELILVCPWISFDAIDKEIKKLFFCLLKRDVIIKIGYERNEDKKKDKDYNTAVKFFDELKARYPKKVIIRKIGTHEKILISDQKMTMFGSHNFLTSSDISKERELGLKTNNPQIIAKIRENLEKEFLQKEIRPIYKNSPIKLIEENSIITTIASHKVDNHNTSYSKGKCIFCGSSSMPGDFKCARCDD